jgi:hypothetical protein
MPHSNNELYQITSKYFCAGIVVHTGTIVHAAPILGWTIGKEFKYFRDYCRRKRWAIVDCSIHTSNI